MHTLAHPVQGLLQRDVPQQSLHQQRHLFSHDLSNSRQSIMRSSQQARSNAAA